MGYWGFRQPPTVARVKRYSGRVGRVGEGMDASQEDEPAQLLELWLGFEWLLAKFAGAVSRHSSAKFIS